MSFSVRRLHADCLIEKLFCFVVFVLAVQMNASKDDSRSDETWIKLDSFVERFDRRLPQLIRVVDIILCGSSGGFDA